MDILQSINAEKIEELSFEEFIKTLEYVNLRLRDKTIPDSETGIYKGDMIVEGLVSPSNEMQMIILEKMFNCLKSDINDEAKGMICYYTLNNLHLFKDGNGRTSRYFYQLFTKNFNTEYLFHPELKENQTKRTKFEKENGIFRVEEFLNMINYNIFLNKLADGSIHDCERLHEYTRVSTCIHDVNVDQHFDTPFLSDEVVSQLGSNAKEFARNITNRNCQITMSGIAMCELLSKNNLLQHFIDLNDEHFKTVSEQYKTDTKGYLIFYVGSNGKYKADVQTEKWDVQTCLDYVKISEKLLIEQFDMIVEASKYYSNVKQDKKEKDYSIIMDKEDIRQMSEKSKEKIATNHDDCIESPTQNEGIKR